MFENSGNDSSNELILQKVEKLQPSEKIKERFAKSVTHLTLLFNEIFGATRKFYFLSLSFSFSRGALFSDKKRFNK